MAEVGWTVEPNARRFAHHRHYGNKVMHLIDAATRHLFPNKAYRMRWVIVLDVPKWDFATPAERTISRLTSSYTTSGAAKLELYKHAKSAIDERQSLTQLQTVISNEQRKLAEANTKRDGCERELVAAARPWATKVQAELQAVTDYERLVELAKRINHLL
ncbi:hypothetical protein LTR08_002486 [Meristemomyces frigidus]|nr:hypothetical protein LTR08_002486 [Meristemomyces frigidus]